MYIVPSTEIFSLSKTYLDVYYSTIESWQVSWPIAGYFLQAQFQKHN